MDEIRQSPDDGFSSAFSGAVARLQVTVLEACREQRLWPAKIAAAVAAAIEFAAQEPESLRLLAVDALMHRPDGGRRYVRTIGHFAELLRAEAPIDERRPKTTEQALVGGIATTIADRTRYATPEELRATVPELVEFVLLPYVGPAEAKRWARWATQRSGHGSRAQ
ncbi:MAG: hypothetical protein ACM3N0_12985 [Chloroflexota bacterium]